MRSEHFRQGSLPVRVPRGHDGYWAIMLRLQKEQGCFTVHDVDDASNANVRCIKRYLKGLVAAGFAEPLSNRPHAIRGKYPTPLYRLLKQPVTAPRVRADGSLIWGEAQEQIWIAIRNLKQFTLAELLFAATTDKLKPKAPGARHYVHLLETAGYLVVVSAGKTRGPRTWRLKPAMNTGPLPPSIKQIAGKFVWDQNLEKFIGPAPAAQEVKP